jgi:hypothetical protein
VEKGYGDSHRKQKLPKMVGKSEKEALRETPNRSRAESVLKVRGFTGYERVCFERAVSQAAERPLLLLSGLA